jgi:hypothetical protein
MVDADASIPNSINEKLAKPGIWPVPLAFYAAIAPIALSTDHPASIPFVALAAAILGRPPRWRPDRRFNNNRQIPIVYYQAMIVNGPGNFQKVLYLSQSI